MTTTDELKPRETVVRVRVKWDAAKEDHPFAWDWAGMLDCEASVLDFYDVGETYVEPTKKELPETTRRRRPKGG